MSIDIRCAAQINLLKPRCEHEAFIKMSEEVINVIRKTFTKNISYVSDNLTYASIEAINILNKVKPHESLYAATVKIHKAENDIAEKVGG
jgi:hypothetical protein